MTLMSGSRLSTRMLARLKLTLVHGIAIYVSSWNKGSVLSSTTHLPAPN